MKHIKYILFLFAIKQTLSWKNYRVNLLSIQADYLDPDYAIMNILEIKKVNRTHTFLHSNCTTLKSFDNAIGVAQLYQYVSNRYKESLPEISIDVCIFLSGKEQKGTTGFVSNLIAQAKAPILDVLSDSTQILPKACPVKPDVYYMFFHIDENKLPAFLLPAGRWMVAVSLKIDGKIRGKARLAFEIINYSSEKQKRRG